MNKVDKNRKRSTVDLLTQGNAIIIKRELETKKKRRDDVIFLVYSG